MAKTRRGRRVDHRLPPEIWYQILTKLPAMWIPWCKSVCKTWYSLISSPDFITDHTAQTLNHSTTNRVLVHHQDLNTLLCELSSHGESFAEEDLDEHDEITEQFRSGDVHIVGSCNGLVCLVKVDERTVTEAGNTEVHSFLIWNPSIGKSVQVPFRPSSQNDYEETSYLLGFGFDSNSGDYKILRIGYFNSYETQYRDPVVSEIFDMRKGVWRAINHPTTPRYVKDHEQPESCVYLDGSLHWIGYDDQSNYVVVSFNLSSEVYQEMGMPGDAEFKDVQDSGLYSLLENEGLLSVVLSRKQQQDDVDQVGCSVWYMKEYGVTESWTKLFNIELPYKRDDSRLLRFWENGVVFVLVLQEGRSDLVVYNPENRISEVLFSVDGADGYICNVCFYKETLVLL